MKTITILWQRLVNEKGQTCERCGLTEKELQKAIQTLKESLAPLGITVLLKMKPLDPATCAKDISQSNRIWINERALEEWLSAEVDKSPCGFCCEELGDNVECRTVTIDDQTYETIPAKLIIKAGLLAASQLINVNTSEPCCSEAKNVSVKINQTNIHFPYSRKVTNIKVKSYSGYKGDERPTSFIVDDREFMVEKIIGQWRTPEYECFKVLADDGREYILKHDVRNDEWYLE